MDDRSRQRRHRGADPEDAKAFSAAAIQILRVATRDYSWLLSHGYVGPAALKLIGDRYQLTRRQRKAVERSACADAALGGRRARRLDPTELCDREVALDAFNQLITLETALGGGILIRGRDGCLRDLAGVHGSWRRVAETRRAVLILGESLAGHGVASALWLVDRPVSNSGRLQETLTEVAESAGWQWSVAVVDDADRKLIATDRVAMSSDSQILDECGPWADVLSVAIAGLAPAPRVIDLH